MSYVPPNWYASYTAAAAAAAAATAPQIYQTYDYYTAAAAYNYAASQPATVAPTSRPATIHELAKTADPITKAVAKSIIGKVHAAVPKKPKPTPVRCDLCNIEVSSEQILDTHLKGKAHQKKLMNSQLLKKIQTSASSATPSPSSSTQPTSEASAVDGAVCGPLLKCDICDLTLNSTQQLQTHFAGTKHKKMEEKHRSPSKPSKDHLPPPPTTVPGSPDQLPEGISCVRPPANQKAGNYQCGPCSCLLNSEIQLQQHLESTKHKAKISGVPLIRKNRGHHPYKRQRFQQKVKTTPDANHWAKLDENAKFKPLDNNFVCTTVMK